MEYNTGFEEVVVLEDWAGVLAATGLALTESGVLMTLQLLSDKTDINTVSIKNRDFCFIKPPNI
jgi:hypothetical protein